MGKPTGFLGYDRVISGAITPKVRTKDFHEFHTPLSEVGQWKQRVQCMKRGVPFCQSGMMIEGMTSGCPFNNLIPEWNDLVFRGGWDQACKRLKKANSFPEFICRVCPALYEVTCTCGFHGEPVGIRGNEMIIIERVYVSGIVAASLPGVHTGKKMAVIGSGPIGLAAADQLNKRGHNVTTCEWSDRISGLLIHGIPDMKLEKYIIERRIAMMKEEGVTFVTEASIRVNYKTKQVMKEYDSVILACGASNPRDTAVPGKDGGGIHFAVDFLTATTESLLDSNLEDRKYISAKDKRVIVISGGDTGNDCMGAAIRHDCVPAAQLGMMPKLPDERVEDSSRSEWSKVCKTDYGQEEATAVFGADPRIHWTTIKEFKKNKGGRMSSAVIVNLAPKKEPESGRAVMVSVEGSEREIPVGLVLITAGFLGAQTCVAETFGMELNGRANVATEGHSYHTNAERIFAAGDMHRGQPPMVWVIRKDREAAREVDEMLAGYGNLA